MPFSLLDSELISQPESIEGTNIRAAAGFLREMGFSDVADNVLKMLRDGKLYWDPTMPDNGDTSPTGDITINHNIIRHPHAAGKHKQNKPFDRERDFAAIVELARTLFHEKVHVHQSALFKIGSNLTHGATPHEQEAWEETILALNRWFRTLYDAYRAIPEDPREKTNAQIRNAKRAQRRRALLKAIAVLDAKITYLGDFTSAETACHGDPNCRGWRDFEGQLAPVRSRLQALLDSLAEPRREQAEERVGQLIRREHERERLCAATMPHLPTDTDVAAVLVGREGAFDVAVTNRGRQSLEATIPAGAVLVPSKPRYAAIVVARTARAMLRPLGTTTVPLAFYSLEPEKRAP